VKGVRNSPDFSNYWKYLSLLAKEIRFDNHDNEETNIIFSAMKYSKPFQ
jgi:hypothetical protein